MNTSCLKCGRIIPSGIGGRCDQCKIKRVKPLGTGDNYRTKAWARTRQQAIRLAGGQCQACGMTMNLQVHHITPVRLGGTDDLGNLSVLCASCHPRVEAQQRRERQGR